ncbi:hypothetical protein V1478_014848 [Vespula squamosa]|uniref:Uncharacterized protein n=1 Tax=Vespula squamosa TaxID=30214 RepID=A0ABD2A5U6_VESSQ
MLYAEVLPSWFYSLRSCAKRRGSTSVQKQHAPTTSRLSYHQRRR